MFQIPDYDVEQLRMRRPAVAEYAMPFSMRRLFDPQAAFISMPSTSSRIVKHAAPEPDDAMRLQT
jgi:hypothetical protein